MPLWLEAFIAERPHFRGVLEDKSWDKPGSSVWLVGTTDGTEVIVKQNKSDASFHRELDAYENHLPALRTTQTVTPILIENDPANRILVTTQIRGDLARNLLEPADDNDVTLAIHSAAGSALRALSAETTRISSDDLRSLRIERQSYLEAEALSRVKTCDRLFNKSQRRTVQAAMQILRDEGAEAIVGWTHGDFQPRNWLWDGATRQLGVIDFECSGIGFLLEDLTWLHAALWARRPEARQAFLAGAQLTLTEEDDRFLDALTVIGALGHYADGLSLGIEVKIKRAQAVIEAAASRVM